MTDIVERLRREGENAMRVHLSLGMSKLCEEAAAEIERLREALEFYRDPFAWKKKHDPDNDVRVPDFYSELCFGDTAEDALAIEQKGDQG